MSLPPRNLARGIVVAAAIATLPASVIAFANAPAARTVHAGPLAAQFRGCVAAGWCRLQLDTREVHASAALRVRPDGVPTARGSDGVAVAIRDRLNALLSSMIHQHKRIVLYDLRELDDGSFAARVVVNEADVALDPALAALRKRASGITD